MKNAIVILILAVASNLPLSAAAQGTNTGSFSNFLGRILGSVTNNQSGGNSSSNTNGNNNGVNNTNQTDVRWLSRVASASLHEIAVGQLAQANSANASVQAYGTTLAQQHTAAYERAAQLATGFGGSVPTEPTRSDAQLHQRLGNLSGDEFDKAFLRLMVRDLRKLIPSFETEALNGRNAETRAFARGQLPILMDQLVAAIELQESLGQTPAQLRSN